jgi:hypothetical protein
MQVRLNDFGGEFAMPGRIASQGAYLELSAVLKGAYYGASLLPGCADYGDELLICGLHMQCASLSLSIDEEYIYIDTFGLDTGYIKEQNSFAMAKNTQDPVHCWLVLGKAFRAAAKYLYTELEETGIDDTDFRILEVLLNKGPFAGEYDRPKGEPHTRLDQYGRIVAKSGHRDLLMTRQLTSTNKQSLLCSPHAKRPPQSGFVQVGECGAIQGLAPTSPENPHFVEMERPPLYTRVRGIF